MESHTFTAMDVTQKSNKLSTMPRPISRSVPYFYVKIQMDDPERKTSRTQVIGFTNWISYSWVPLWVNTLFSWWCNYWLDWSFYMLLVSFWPTGTGDQNATVATCPKRWLFGSKSLVIFRKVMMLLEECDMKNASIFGHKNVSNISRKRRVRVLQDMIK